MPFTEANFKKTIIELFRDQLGYDSLYGPDVVRDYTQPLHLELLQALLHHLFLPKLMPEELIVNNLAQ